MDMPNGQSVDGIEGLLIPDVGEAAPVLGPLVHFRPEVEPAVDVQEEPAIPGETLSDRRAVVE